MKLVIFDCDGTIVDSRHNITAAMTHAFTAIGLPAPAAPDVLGIVGLSLPETFQVLAGDKPLAIQQALAHHYRDAFISGALRERAAEPIFAGLRATIEELARRPDVVLGVATGKSKRGVARLLDAEGWQRHFHTIQTADDHPSKPHPSMILTAMAETGTAPERTVMIGDTTFDVTMARNAGVTALGVAWGYHARDLLAEAGAHAIVDDGHRLLGVIDTALGA